MFSFYFLPIVSLKILTGELLKDQSSGVFSSFDICNAVNGLVELSDAEIPGGFCLLKKVISVGLLEDALLGLLVLPLAFGFLPLCDDGDGEYVVLISAIILLIKLTSW